MLPRCATYEYAPALQCRFCHSKRGGAKTTNVLFIDKVLTRQPQNQYVHFKGIVLSMGKPNEWYVSKCIAVADKKTDGNLIGKELPTLCLSLIYRDKAGRYAVQNTSKKCSFGSVREGI